MYNIGPSLEPCIVPVSEVLIYEHSPSMCTKNILLLSHILISSITSSGKPMILSLLSYSFTFTTWKAALKSMLDIIA